MTKMSKAELHKAPGLDSNAMTKIRRDEPVAMVVLERMCGTLGTDFRDITQYVHDES